MASFSYLPSEIVMQIADYLDDYDMFTAPEMDHRAVLKNRQAGMAKFCLVNRQWYAVGISKLYCRPFLSSGNSFQQFLQTICPNAKNKALDRSDLGSLIYHLDLGNLVHHSSNSKTGRLINKARNLRFMIAPRYSFSVNSLAPLSKCSEMKILDLSRVSSSGITFPTLKNTISKLKKLWCLSLPVSVPLTPTIQNTTGYPGPWPESLTNMTISGDIDARTMERFEWPPKLHTLKISLARGLTNAIIDSILYSPGVQRGLEDFTIESNCTYASVGQFEEVSTSVMYELAFLDRVKIPCDMARFFGMLGTSQMPMDFKALSLGEPADGDGDYVDPDLGEDVILSLELGPLCEIWGLTLPPSFMQEYHLEREEIDDVIMSHLDDVSDEELDEWPALPGLSVRR
ncbi:hypothetical protein N7493_011833 [Penicillium malachiteum]|uniref:F-box domain-containing protein n=1 Tax=Penicillium malachiteum TaxID=1324776 RepID=A0AAD6MQ73_9EURO|nr:hypothetical protein N7493_011833 [Penicillium malachiteum]